MPRPRKSPLPIDDATTKVVQLSPAGPQTERRLQRAAEIVTAARAAFLENGFQGTSVAQIAAQVGVVEGLLYAYYPTKRDLLNEVLRGMYEPLIRELESSLARMEGLRSRLRFLIWRHVRVYVEEPNLSRLVLHEVRLGAEYSQSVLHDLHVQYTGYLVRVLEEAIDAGELPADTDVELARSIVYGTIEHRMWPVLHGRGAVDVDDLADRLTDMLLRALRPEVDANFSGSASATVEQRLARLENLIAGLDLPAAPRLG